MPPKQHGLSTSFLVENLLNASPGSLVVEKPLTGFSDSQEQIQIVDGQSRRIQNPSSAIPCPVIAVSSRHLGKKAMATKMIMLLKF